MTGHSVLFSSSPGDAPPTLFSPAGLVLGHDSTNLGLSLALFWEKSDLLLAEVTLGWILLELF